MKTYLMGAAAAAMILTACSGSNESAETGSFTTPGLTFADAHGHVKSIKVTTSSAELKGDSIVAAEIDFYNSSVTYTFDEEGRLKTYTEAFEEKPLLSYQVDYQADSIGVARNILANVEAALPVRLTFDDKGHIVKFEYAYDDYSEMSRNVTWEWDDQGRITSEYFTGCEWAVEHRYNFDDKGLRTSAKQVSSDMGEEYKSDETYTYPAFDDKGNWTVRTTTRRQTSIVDDSGNETPSTGAIPEYTIETRTIEYYPEK